jgi:hypothetical protein
MILDFNFLKFSLTVDSISVKKSVLSVLESVIKNRISLFNLETFIEATTTSLVFIHVFAFHIIYNIYPL